MKWDKNKNLKNFIRGFSLISIAYGVCVFFWVFLPFQTFRTFESNPLDVITVSTELYQRNLSLDYPIGALVYGNQKIMLKNKSNEKIKSNFVLEIKNMTSNSIEIESKSESNEKDIIIIDKDEKQKLKIPFSVNSHGHVFLDIDINDNSMITNSGTPYPISVQGWSFKND
jgi:hypothetical protein